MEAQSLEVKRAEVEFHQFASLGEPERAMAAYLAENERRGAIIRQHLDFIGPMTPFLEIGSNAGHSSYMLANEFDAGGFALDISADSLRYGKALMPAWGLKKAPVRVAGDALRLPFADNSLRFVMAFQMLSQFMDIEAVFVEVKRVLAPGGVFLFAEEPIRRILSLRLYRAPYEREMKPWERKLHAWGLLGYLVQDVIGAHQEESFGIRQNHTMTLLKWHNLIQAHFPEFRHHLFVPERGWGERIVRQAGRRIDRLGSDWLPARLLGGTLAAVCKKAGAAPAGAPAEWSALLRCPDCGSGFVKDEDALVCTGCRYRAPDEDGVYNLLPTAIKKELYPGDRPDIIDFSQAPHEDRLINGFFELEGIYGNKYRWIGSQAAAKLERVSPGAQILRVRGYASETWLRQSQPKQVRIVVNGAEAGAWEISRPGLFVLETPVADAATYLVEVHASPTYQVAGDDRHLSVNLSMLRLIRG